MTLSAAHHGFSPQRLPIERRASPHTCDSYAYAFRLLFEYSGNHIKLPSSELNLEQLDAPPIVTFLIHLETSRGNGTGFQEHSARTIKSFMHYMEYRVPSALDQIDVFWPSRQKDGHALVRHLTAQDMNRPGCP